MSHSLHTFYVHTFNNFKIVYAQYIKTYFEKIHSKICPLNYCLYIQVVKVLIIPLERARIISRVCFNFSEKSACLYIFLIKKSTFFKGLNVTQPLKIHYYCKVEMFLKFQATRSWKDNASTLYLNCDVCNDELKPIRDDLNI